MGVGYCINQTDYQNTSTAELELALANGAKLDDQGLLLIILSRHHDVETATFLAKQLLNRFSSLSSILGKKIGEIQMIEGISRSAVLELLRIKHLLNAISRSSVTNYPVLDCYEKLINFCVCQFSSSDKEQFHVLLLNRRYELIHHECMQTGTLDHVTVYPREVLRLALTHSASFLILAHNHPVGKAKPSKADIAMTEQLCGLAQGLGIAIVDHLILAGNDSYSFLADGRMPAPGRNLFDIMRPKPQVPFI